jgi:hypothetical protein
MTAPPRRRERRAPNGNPASSRTTAAKRSSTKDTADLDLDADLDRQLLGVDASIWAALFAGEFRLAVRCRVCRRWLTADRSKRRHTGPRCAAKVAKQ